MTKWFSLSGQIQCIKEWYWNIVPYDYRPWQIWYWIKCYFIRYSTVKSRYLDHKWHDRTEVLPYTMFEILSDFIEKECSPERIDWKASGHTVLVNNRKVNVRKEMQDLYDWWHKIYNKAYPVQVEKLWSVAHKHEPSSFFVPVDYNKEEVEEKDAELFLLDPKFKTNRDKTAYNKALKDINKLDEKMEAELEKRMHRLVNLTSYLWT